MILEQAGIPHMQAGGKVPPTTPHMNAALALGITNGLGNGKMAPKDLPEGVMMPMYHGQPEFYYFQEPYQDWVLTLGLTDFLMYKGKIKWSGRLEKLT